MIQPYDKLTWDTPSYHHNLLFPSTHSFQWELEQKNVLIDCAMQVSLSVSITPMVPLTLCGTGAAAILSPCFWRCLNSHDESLFVSLQALLETSPKASSCYRALRGYVKISQSPRKRACQLPYCERHTLLWLILGEGGCSDYRAAGSSHLFLKGCEPLF